MTALLDIEDRHWRAQGAPPASLIRLCLEHHGDAATAPGIIELIFEILFFARDIEDSAIQQAFDEFLGGELDDAVGVPWPEAARRHVEIQLPRLQHTQRLRLMRATTSVLSSLLVGSDPAWLGRIAITHGAAAARAAALRILASFQSPESNALLLDRIQRDVSTAVRQIALDALHRAAPEAESSLRALKRIAVTDSNLNGYAERLLAIERLGHPAKEDAGSRRILEDLEGHGNPVFRRQAGLALVECRTAPDETIGPFPPDYPARCAGAFQRVARGNEKLRGQAFALLDQGDRYARRSLLEHWWATRPEADGFLELLLALIEHEPDRVVRQSALDCLAESPFEERFSILPDRARHDPHWAVRLTALRHLPKVGGPAALEVLLHCLANDDEVSIREQASKSLTDAFQTTQVREALMAAAAGDERSDVRLFAVRSLALGFAGDERVRDFLLGRSAIDIEWIDDTDGEKLDLGEDVRGHALLGLARGWPDDAKVRAWIRRRSEEEPSSFVRRDALEALARGWPGDPETVEWLCEAALEGDIDDRGKAIEILARSWPSRPAVRECLLGVVDRETVPGYVGTALRGLQEDPFFADGSRLRVMATEEPRPLVRQRAAEQLARQAPEEPSTLELILERSTVESSPDVRLGLLDLAARTWPAAPQVRDSLRIARDTDEVDWLRKRASSLLRDLPSAPSPGRFDGFRPGLAPPTGTGRSRR